LIRDDPKIGHGTWSRWHKQIGAGCACACGTSTTCSSGTSILEQVVLVPLAQAGWLYQTCSIGSRRGQKRPLLVPWHKSYTHDGGHSFCHGTSSIPRWSLYLFHLCQLVPKVGLQGRGQFPLKMQHPRNSPHKNSDSSVSRSTD